MFISISQLKNEDVDVIKIDATANDWPKSLFDVSGFPTIFWKPKDSDKKPIRYNVCINFITNIINVKQCLLDSCNSKIT